MNKKSFILLQFAIVIALAVAMIGNTYSWADRPSQLGSEMSLKYSTVINGNSASGLTYGGSYNEQTGEIVYDSAPITSKKANVVKGDKWYFKTVVKNPLGSVATNVSLCAKLISYSAALAGDYYIGVTTPINSHRTYKATSANTVEWASILSQYEVGKGAQAVIEWYVEFDDAGSFTIDGIYLVNS
jgi:hypothetical protein